MQTLVIQTQHRENYAAHNEGYKHGVDQAHWKYKVVALILLLI